MSKAEQKTEADSISSEHSLRRREWLTAFAAGGFAAATAALPRYGSGQTLPPTADSPELELRYIKDAIKPLRARNYVEEAKRQGILDRGIDDALAADINQFLETNYQALVYSELVNALPDDVRDSKQVQRDIAEMSPVLDQAVADAYFVIGMADDDLKKDIDRELKENPDLLMDMAAGLDEEGAGYGMGIRGRLRLRRASSQLSARLRVQSTDEVVTDLTDKITRIGERNGTSGRHATNFQVSSAARRMVSLDDDSLGAPAPPPRPPEVETSPASPTDLSLAQRREVQRLERKAKSLTRASRALAGTGGALLIAGGIALGVTGGLGGAFVMCVGGLALLLALFVLAAAARRRRELEEAKAGSTTDQ
jgi:hypothetical protein